MHYEEKLFIKLTQPVLEFLKKTNVSAEELTLFRIFFGLFTALILFSGVYVYSLIIISFYQLVMLLDYIDGPLARYRKTFKISWVYLDLMTHLILAVLFLSAVILSYYFEKNSLFFLILGFIMIILFLLNNIFNKKSPLDRWTNIKKYPHNWKNNWISPIISWAKIERPFNLFFIFIILNQKKLLISFYFLIYLLSTIYKFYSEFKNLENEK